MGTVSNIFRVKYSIGELIHHKLFDYRGVIVDMDVDFQGSEDWYETMAKSRPAKNKPWYHVLVHDRQHTTYVAEQNLERDQCKTPIEHPMLSQFFCRMEDGKYILNKASN